MAPLAAMRRLDIKYELIVRGGAIRHDDNLEKTLCYGLKGLKPLYRLLCWTVKGIITSKLIRERFFHWSLLILICSRFWTS